MIILLRASSGMFNTSDSWEASLDLPQKLTKIRLFSPQLLHSNSRLPMFKINCFYACASAIVIALKEFVLWEAAATLALTFALLVRRHLSEQVS